MHSSLLAVAGLAGPLEPQEPEIRRLRTALVTESWLPGEESPASLISVSGVELLRHRPVSDVCGTSWILRFSDSSPCVPTKFSGVQQDRRRRRTNVLVAEACFYLLRAEDC